MKMRFVDVDGASTRCIVAGDPDAFPVVLIHGLALTADVWLRNIDALARKYRVVALDLLGHGFTQPPAGTVADIPAKLRHLRGFADALGLDRFAISGSSYGALLGTLFFLQNRDRVAKLVINGSGSCFNTEAQLGAQVGKLYELYAPTLTDSTPEMWRERLSHNFFDRKAIPPELMMILPHCYAQPWAAPCWHTTIGVMRDAAAFRPFRILDRLEEVTIPALVVWGREDRGGSLESAVAAVGRMPRARLATFDRCGHYPMLEHADAYNTLVSDFLAE